MLCPRGQSLCAGLQVPIRLGAVWSTSGHKCYILDVDPEHLALWKVVGTRPLRNMAVAPEREYGPQRLIPVSIHFCIGRCPLPNGDPGRCLGGLCTEAHILLLLGLEVPVDAVAHRVCLRSTIQQLQGGRQWQQYTQQWRRDSLSVVLVQTAGQRHQPIVEHNDKHSMHCPSAAEKAT